MHLLTNEVRIWWQRIPLGYHNRQASGALTERIYVRCARHPPLSGHHCVVVFYREGECHGLLPLRFMSCRASLVAIRTANTLMSNMCFHSSVLPSVMLSGKPIPA